MIVEKVNKETQQVVAVYEASEIVFTDSTLQMGNQMISLSGNKYMFREQLKVNVIGGR